MSSFTVTRTVRLPDRVRIGRYRKAPELGPHILMFSGGSALNAFSRVLKSYTHNSTHLVTPFDSGGSSAKLRQAFDMPSIGDLRSRLMALADETVTGNPEVYRVFTYRFAQDADRDSLLRRLQQMQRGSDELVASVPDPMRTLICNQIGYFCDAMPDDFDLCGASIGNLILAGGYLNNHQDLDPIIFLFSKLVGVLGTVRAVVADNLHLGAELTDGTLVFGQHRLTGKEVAPLQAPIAGLFLTGSSQELIQVAPELSLNNKELISEADVICYPPGSFYTSLVAHLLVHGVGQAVAATPVPKVYIPNLGRDVEQLGMTLDQSVDTLLDYLHRDVGTVADSQLLNLVLMDTRRGRYSSELSLRRMAERGIQVVDTRLISHASAPYYDPGLLAEALLSLT